MRAGIFGVPAALSSDALDGRAAARRRRPLRRPGARRAAARRAALRCDSREAYADRLARLSDSSRNASTACVAIKTSNARWRTRTRPPAAALDLDSRSRDVTKRELVNIVLIVNTNNRTTIVDMNNTISISRNGFRRQDKDTRLKWAVQYNNKASVQDLFKIHDGVRRWRATRGAGGAASMYPSRIIYFRVACPAVTSTRGGAWRGYRYVSCLRPVLARVHQLISVSHRRVVPASCVFA